MNTTVANKALGIDISAWQNPIVWSKVAGSGLDISFLFIKASEGISYASPQFSGQWKGCLALQAPGSKFPLRAAYHYWRAGLDGKAQAQWFLKCALKGEMPPVLDLEDDAGLPVSSTKEALTAAAASLLAYVNVISDSWGQKVLIYSGPWFWNRLANAASKISDLCEYWGATYRAGITAPDLPLGWKTWRFWQYSSSGSVAGFSGSIDMDYFNGTKEDLLTWAGLPVVAPVVDLSLEQKVSILWQEHLAKSSPSLQGLRGGG